MGLIVAQVGVGDRVKLADGLHGRERLEIGLHLRPLFGIFLSDDRCLRVGIIRDQIVFELGGDNVRGVLCNHGQEPGVCLVGEPVTARLDHQSRVEIAVSKVAIDVIIVGQGAAHCFDGVIDTLDVKLFGLLVGTLDREHFERANLGQDIDPAGIKMACESRGLPVGLPVVVGGGLNEIFFEVIKIGAGKVLWEVLLVQDGLGPGDVGKEPADSVAVDANGGLFAADDVGKVDAVSFKERLAKKSPGDFEADEF